jgi:hypothetical protein
MHMRVRLAFRREGEYVNAYLAPPDSMKDAMLLGTMRVAYLEQLPGAWDRWKQLMSDILKRAIGDRVGETPEMIQEKAPEHERSGNG